VYRYREVQRELVQISVDLVALEQVIEMSVCYSRREVVVQDRRRTKSKRVLIFYQPLLYKKPSTPIASWFARVIIVTLLYGIN
jgi:hypothetical protein